MSIRQIATTAALTAFLALSGVAASANDVPEPDSYYDWDKGITFMADENVGGTPTDEASFPSSVAAKNELN